MCIRDRFKAERLIEAIPATCKKIAVLDRTKEPGAQGEPLYLDVVTALANAGKTDIQVIGGRYGLGSKDTPPASVFAVYSELKKDEMKRQFTIGIVDDAVSYTHLQEKCGAERQVGEQNRAGKTHSIVLFHQPSPLRMSVLRYWMASAR